ncbi:MAG: alpha/beta fold hydrolase [Actinomycetota bacterium]
MSDGLVLIHAFPVDARMWQSQLGLGVPLIAPNMPGFGGSPPAGEVMTMESGARRCIEEMDAAAINRAVVCGLSLGGYVAFELLRQHRHRIAGLVLANTRAEEDDEPGKERRRRLAARLLEEGSAFLVADPPPLLSEGAPAELWEEVRGKIADQPPEVIAAASLGMAGRPDSRADLHGIEVPTLVVTSTGDTLIPSAVSAPMAEAIPGAHLEVLEDAGHLSNLEAPEEFNRVLRVHLKRCGMK